MTDNDSTNAQNIGEENDYDTEEQFLTLNIFKLLSCDMQINILTFLCIQDLYPISLSCKHGAYLVMSPETDGYLWGSMASQLGLNKEEISRVIMNEEDQKKNHELSEEETTTSLGDESPLYLETNLMNEGGTTTYCHRLP